MEIREYLQQVHAEGNYREIPTVMPLTVTDYSTNDYMGLAQEPGLQAKFFADPISATVPMTSSAARLLAPRQIEYTNLEVFLSLLYKRHRGEDTAALMFNSGYHANTGLIPAIAGKDTLVIADRLVHASIIDGIVLSRAPFQRFRHNDFDHLEQMLITKGNGHKHVLVIVESVYSMDGDHADIERLLAIKRQHPNVILYIDEAHAFGVLGPKGLGLSAASIAPAEIDVIVGTFGKAAASMGAFAVVGRDMRDYLVNTARSFIFSTAIPPCKPHGRVSHSGNSYRRTTAANISHALVCNSATPWPNIPTYLLRLHTYSRSSWATPKKPLNFRASFYHVTA